MSFCPAEGCHWATGRKHPIPTPSCLMALEIGVLTLSEVPWLSQPEFEAFAWVSSEPRTLGGATGTSCGSAAAG